MAANERRKMREIKGLALQSTHTFIQFNAPCKRKTKIQSIRILGEAVCMKYALARTRKKLHLRQRRRRRRRRRWRWCRSLRARCSLNENVVMDRWSCCGRANIYDGTRKHITHSHWLQHTYGTDSFLFHSLVHIHGTLGALSWYDSQNMAQQIHLVNSTVQTPERIERQDKQKVIQHGTRTSVLHYFLVSARILRIGNYRHCFWCIAGRAHTHTHDRTIAHSHAYILAHNMCPWWCTQLFKWLVIYYYHRIGISSFFYLPISFSVLIYSMGAASTTSYFISWRISCNLFTHNTSKSQ